MENNFAKNLKYIREKRKISQQQLADKIGIDRATISYWESEKADPTMINVCKLAELLNISLIDLIGGNLSNNDSQTININDNTIKIPVLKTIKANIAIEEQQDILEYIEIPKIWTKEGKKFYGLTINGDSMSPKYNEQDIVIFEQTEDFTKANHKDCVITIKDFDATFKNVTINNNGITLMPFNLNNSEGYQPTFYTKEQIENLPIKIIGIGIEKRTKL